jgi:hypothetical protein
MSPSAFPIAQTFAGGLLGLLIFDLFRNRARGRHPGTNRHAAAGYGALGLAGVAVLIPGWPATFWLLWPIVSLGLAATSSMGFLAAAPVKRNGRLAFSSCMLWGPVPFGQWRSWLYYKRQSPAWNEIVPGILLGRRLTRRDARTLLKAGTGAVLDVAGEFSETPALRQVVYRNMNWRDLTAPTTDELREAAEFIELNRTRTVFIHCKAGYSRSAAAVGAWLLLNGGLTTVEEVGSLLRGQRPGVVIRPEITRAWNLLATSRTLSARER